MVMYKSVQEVYEKSVDGRVFTAEWRIAVRVVLSHTPSVQGATRLPWMSTLPVCDVRGPLPFSCTDPYSGCTKILLTTECAPPSGGLP